MITIEKLYESSKEMKTVYNIIAADFQRILVILLPNIVHRYLCNIVCDISIGNWK